MADLDLREGMRDVGLLRLQKSMNSRGSEKEQDRQYAETQSINLSVNRQEDHPSNSQSYKQVHEDD